MVTTNSFPNIVTSSKEEDIERNSLTKEDVEGKVRKQIQEYSSTNGGGSQVLHIE